MMGVAATGIPVASTHGHGRQRATDDGEFFN
jgi:hypothetical protein